MEQTTHTGVLGARVAPLARGAGWVFDGFRSFILDWGAWLLISIVMLVGSLVIQTGVPVLGTAVVFLLSPVMVGGLMLALADREGGRPLQFSDLFRAFAGAHRDQLLLLGVISLLLNLLVLIAVASFVLVFADIDALTRLAQTEDMLVAAQNLTFAMVFLVGALVYLALLIPVTMLVWFAPALIVLENEKTLAAMRHSFVGCLRNFMPYFIYGLVGLVVFPLLLIFTLGLGTLVLMPVGLASIYIAYKDIFHRHG